MTFFPNFVCLYLDWSAPLTTLNPTEGLMGERNSNPVSEKEQGFFIIWYDEIEENSSEKVLPEQGG